MAVIIYLTLQAYMQNLIKTHTIKNGEYTSGLADYAANKKI